MCPQAVEYHDLQFTKVPTNRYSTSNIPYRAWVDVGMPKIQDVLLEVAFYLYQTVEDAEAGKNTGGTGFIVGISSTVDQYTHIYGISNWHVAINGGFSVIRLNRRDGGTDIIDLDPGQWEKHPDGYDIAACSVTLDLDQHQVGVVLKGSFATESIVRAWEIGPGEDVFMVGRFLDHDGGPTNKPAVRFGHISVMPSPIKQPTGVMGDSYCIDLHSRSGYSGSPVFVYRTPGTNFAREGMETRERFMYLLGVHWGQFPELWEISTKKKKEEAAEAGLITDGKYIEGVSGMTCVCPAWQILELLDIEQFAQEREVEDQRLEKERIEDGPLPVAESASGVSGDDILGRLLKMPPETHKELKEKKPAK